MLDRLPLWLSALIKEILSISFNLFKLMIPIIIIVKIIEELGGIKYIGMALEPIMQLVGLPAEMGLVWATTMITSIYGGMIIFATTAISEPLSIAQVTVLGSMMLFAHSLPIEVRIAQKAGVRIVYMLILRIGGALLLGLILHYIYSSGAFLTEENTAIWKPQISSDTSLLGWVFSQIKTLFQVFLIIAVLVVFLKLLKVCHIERLLAYLLKPLLKILGLGKESTSITIIGITLGLTYGGGLLINEAQNGKISKMDVFGSLSLLAICHSIIEDTLLIILLGADITGALYLRVLLALIITSLVIRFAKKLSSESFSRYFVYSSR
ncbi:MAG: hypothetical protein V3U71_09225 [Cocleimonas sp.]